jgi:NAD(P)-dependent dehydrogenase (short-subunit alcohol dehydrogenase family)
MRRPIHRIGLDVTDGAARSAIAAARHHFGPLDVIMNNAGDKTVAMVRNEPEIDLSELIRVSSPTRALQGDRDITTVDHSAAVVTALPNARLAVLPGSMSCP